VHSRARRDRPQRRAIVAVLAELVHGGVGDAGARIGLPGGTPPAAPGRHEVSLRRVGRRRGPRMPGPRRQHSMTLTARPPSLVSLYFVDMSSPVWRFVSTTASSDT